MSTLAVDVKMSTQGQKPVAELPLLPQTNGRAGMFAGVSNGRLFCMAGADFPAGLPWEGGKKKWYADIFMLQEDSSGWVKIDQQLPQPLGYGISLTYKNKIFVIGGNNESGHSAGVFSLEWKGNALAMIELSPLPHAIANMSGAIVGQLLVIVGGMIDPASRPLKTGYMLDLERPDTEWTEMPEWPGPERVLPVCGAYSGKLYMFSGENTVVNAAGIRQRHILQDGYSFSPEYTDGRWTGVWTRLADIPKGMSAGPNPAPLINQRFFRLWGGVDRVVGLHKNPESHPGIPGTVLNYYPDTDSWELDVSSRYGAGRVTLPTVVFNDYTYYVSGETGPGKRTSKVSGILNKN